MINNNNNTADNVRVLNVTGGSLIIDGLVITGGHDKQGAGVHMGELATVSVIHSSVSGNAGDRFQISNPEGSGEDTE